MKKICAFLKLGALIGLFVLAGMSDSGSIGLLATGLWVSVLSLIILVADAMPRLREARRREKARRETGGPLPIKKLRFFDGRRAM